MPVMEHQTGLAVVDVSCGGDDHGG